MLRVLKLPGYEGLLRSAEGISSGIEAENVK